MKLHITQKNQNEMSNVEYYKSITKYIELTLEGRLDFNEIQVEIKQYPQKKQTKIFIRFFKDLNAAKMLFRVLYKSKDIPMFDIYGEKIYYRKMKAYLVKEEAILEELASQRFDEDLGNKQGYTMHNTFTSREAISSIEAHSNSFGSIMSRGVQSVLHSARPPSRGGSSNLRQSLSGVGGTGNVQLRNHQHSESEAIVNFAPGQTPINFSSTNHGGSNCSLTEMRGP